MSIMKKRTPEQRLLLEQVKQIADGLAKTFAPFCEVVVHDLLDPAHAVLAIHNNLSGRAVGHPATELGLARIMDPGFEQVIANYPNRFSDGRQAKSTSIGIKNNAAKLAPSTTVVGKNHRTAITQAAIATAATSGCPAPA